MSNLRPKTQIIRWLGHCQNGCKEWRSHAIIVRYLLMALKLIAGILLVTWLLLVIIGKGGFVHILLLNGLGVAAVEIMTIIRTRMTA